MYNLRQNTIDKTYRDNKITFKKIKGGIMMDIAIVVSSAVSIVLACATLIINVIIANLRDKKHKKNELLLSHLKESLEWLNTMHKDILALSEKLCTLIGVYSSMEKKEQLRTCFNAESNRIGEKSLAFYELYADMNNILGIDLDLNEFNKSIFRYVDGLRQISKKYTLPDKDQVDLNEINSTTSAIVEQIKKRKGIILEEIKKILLD